jgi:dephospho-CoA kinase
MLKIGITGSIGSGKTTVCKILETLNVPVYYADDRSKYLLANNDEVKQQLVDSFGSSIFINNNLDRTALAGIVFSDRDKLKKLEGIVHPAVKKDFKNWAEKQSATYVIKEAALLLEAGTNKDLDKLITVTAPLEIRIQRALSRDKSTRAEILAREEMQWPDEKKVAMADYVIYNGDQQLLLPQVLALHKKFISGNI